MGHLSNDKADGIFTRHWNIYKKILEHNYMCHAEFTAAIGHIINTQLPETPLTVLDLGCGDAALISRLLAGYNVTAYTGYDSSAEVLKHADIALQQLHTNSRLVNEVLQQAPVQEGHRYNVVYSSFAIHHLPDEEKLAFFKAAYDTLLAPGGVFIYVDVFKKPQQSRTAYLELYLQNIARHWKALTPAELALVEEHITRYDFPAEKTLLVQQLRQSGFTVEEPSTGDGVHGMLVLTK